MPRSPNVGISLHDISNTEVILELDNKVHDGDGKKVKKLVVKKRVSSLPTKASFSKESVEARKEVAAIYDKVLVVDNIQSARTVVQLLTTKYKNFIHACDMEVANIDVKDETPVGHGQVTCFSIYSANSNAQVADFGNGKTCISVDVLDGGRDVLTEFAPFFEDPSIKKVWHNYSFDSHVIENHGIKVARFHADTMHLARLWDSSRRTDGGYSLEGLTNDRRVMDVAPENLPNAGKTSMETIFGKKKVRKDGSEGKVIAVDPVEKLQREDRELWICYSSLDSMSTLRLYESLKRKLETKEWIFDGCPRGTMYDFYEEYWRPFGALLVKMETEGMLVDRGYLSEIEKAAIAEREVAANKFRKWASKYCPDAKYMNVNSDTQIRQLLFGGIENSIVEDLKIDMFTPSGWPSVSGDALRSLAGKIPTEQIYTIDDNEGDEEDTSGSEHSEQEVDESSSYGTAYEAFGGGKKGKEACNAIAALCEICSIDSLISNFILPLQNQPALEKDRYKIRQAFVAAPGNSLIVADYGQLELRILAHLTNCKSMLDAFKAGGDFHSRTAMNMYQHIRDAVDEKKVLLEWHPQPGQEKPPVPLLKLWYGDRKEVLAWQKRQKKLAHEKREVYTLLGRSRRFPNLTQFGPGQRGHIERAAINAPVQGSAADVAMCAMLEIERNTRLKELGWRLLLQVHDEVILEGPSDSAETAKAIVVECMSKPFYGTNILNVDLAVDAKCAKSWYAAK
ncbi:hypothetical protein C2845_PM14G04030 [Panicum miliaceum]|uniref:DNA-directed DNA polymerase family A palm domain-containing protein n=1 Tax=Panicum miliaceum TaxID=4540 RepID=A0A3L6PLV0_PANMI|nr:hypothetical protein C2845_PM14G04030 [Panicum miliaceum]